MPKYGTIHKIFYFSFLTWPIHLVEESQCEHHKIEGKNPKKKGKKNLDSIQVSMASIMCKLFTMKFHAWVVMGPSPWTLMSKEREREREWERERERVYTYEFQAMGQIEDCVVYQSVRFDSLEVDPTLLLFFFPFFNMFLPVF